MSNTQTNHGQTARVAIALGSNLGDSRAIVESALKTLAHTPGFTLLRQSPFYQTAAVGPPQPDYINACALCATNLEPHAVLSALLQIEHAFGRIRRERWGARLLDLDLLLYDDRVLDSPDLQIPHPRLIERAFVLVPLADIAPDWVEPVSGQAIAQLAQQVDSTGVQALA